MVIQEGVQKTYCSNDASQTNNVQLRNIKKFQSKSFMIVFFVLLVSVASLLGAWANCLKGRSKAVMLLNGVLNNR